MNNCLDSSVVERWIEDPKIMVRFHFEAQMKFEIENIENLKRLSYLTERTEYEVIQDALSLYEHLLTKRRQGQKLFLGTDRDQIKEYQITTFEIAKEKL